MRALLIAMIALGSVAASSPAAAQIYKYKKSDGTVVYTDVLSQLPREQQMRYQQLEEEAARKRKELEQAIGKEELQRREAEAQKVDLEKKQMEEAERQRRLIALNETLTFIRERAAKREASKAQWQAKMKAAIDKRDRLYKQFTEAQQKVESLGARASFTLLPGQAEELEQARKDAERLEGELDRAIEDIQFTLPEEARKAGVPPGWLR
jgi:hypothetical protein